LVATGLCACALRGARRQRVCHGRLRRWRLLSKDEVEDPTEAEAERRQGELEGMMHLLAKSEDFQAAAAIRDDLSRRSLDDDAKVLATFHEFYDALTRKDLKRIESLWLRASHIRCLHPRERWSVGHTQVVQSWGKLFRGRRFLLGKFCVENVQMHVRGTTATVLCHERLRSASTGRTLQSYNATNIFQKVGSSWFLVLRHVSPSGAGMDTWLSRPEVTVFDECDDDDDEDQQDDVMLELIMRHGEEPDSENEIDSEQEEDPSDADEEDGLADARSAVHALRRLSAEQRLPDQERLRLLSEMLRNPGDSLPERAHSLLLRDVPEKEAEAAWQDFAGLMAMEAERLASPRKADRQGPRK